MTLIGKLFNVCHKKGDNSKERLKISSPKMSQFKRKLN